MDLEQEEREMAYQRELLNYAFFQQEYAAGRLEEGKWYLVDDQRLVVGPAPTKSDLVVELIRRQFDGRTAYHLILQARADCLAPERDRAVCIGGIELATPVE